MLAELSAACGLLDDALAGLDPSLLTGAQCAQVVERLATTEKRCAAVRVLAAARAGDCKAHKERGFPNAGAWLAHLSGIPTGEARAALATGAALGDCPATKKALLAGDVSLAQAAEITKTESLVPGSETALLDRAATTGVAGLREAALKIRLEAQDSDEAHRRQRREQYLRHWRDEHGMIRLSGAFTPEVGVAVVNRIDLETDRLFRKRDDQSEDQREQLAADALAQLVLDGDGASPKSRNAELVLVCDIAAYWRGHRHPGEVCHVIGGGPVPVSVAWDLAFDAFIKAVLHDGVDISTVAHFGRHIRAELRTALALGRAPDFEGAVCAEEGCDRRYGLERDHVDPVAHGGPTSYENLAYRCKPHHREKTERDRAAGLLRPRPPQQPDAIVPVAADDCGCTDHLITAAGPCCPEAREMAVDSCCPEHPGAAGDSVSPEHPGAAGGAGHPERPDRADGAGEAGPPDTHVWRDEAGGSRPSALPGEASCPETAGDLSRLTGPDHRLLALFPDVSEGPEGRAGHRRTNAVQGAQGGQTTTAVVDPGIRAVQ